MHEITFKPGEGCGGYRVLSLIGIGGVAEVYKAVHPTSNAIVALKALRRFFVDNVYLREHLLAEARLLSTLRHDNVVRVDDLGIESGALWMAMEHLPGVTLRTLLRSGKSVPISLAVHIAWGIAAGAGAAHAMGAPHRGLTPENVMILGQRKVKVLDKSAAKLYGWDDRRAARGVIVGSPLYMSPEHVRDEELDPRSDVYALGLILYEMLAGRHPFVPARRGVLSKHQVCQMQLEVDPPPLAEVAPGVPRELSNLVQRAISKDRSRRPHSMGEFERALAGARSGPIVTEAPPVPSLRRISPRSAANVGNAALAAPPAAPPPLVVKRDPEPDDEDRPTLIYRRDAEAPPSSYAPAIQAPPPESRSPASILRELEVAPDSASGLEVFAPLSAPRPPPSPAKIPSRSPLAAELRPRVVRDPVPSLPTLVTAARRPISGSTSPFDLAYESAASGAASTAARRRLRRTSLALRASAAAGAVVAVLALTYARLSAAPGGMEPILKAISDSFEGTAPEAAPEAAALVNAATSQPAPATPVAAPQPKAPSPEAERPAEPKALSICPSSSPVSRPPPQRSPRLEDPERRLSDPYEGLELQPNPYREKTNAHDAKPPAPRAAPKKALYMPTQI